MTLDKVIFQELVSRIRRLLPGYSDAEAYELANAIMMVNDDVRCGEISDGLVRSLREMPYRGHDKGNPDVKLHPGRDDEEDVQ